uniref:Capsid protein n=1 Tax=Genomoviridae sp. TaxID=2202565 RepID=A0A8F5MM42_9VIRU|nr:MAG: capsid protein [Genomoviridae sp.]QXN75572.1 MAG: capsid protein [Genomoviridae sp.]QXN75576.1 MAG: capsid protein [Genomoviridae sp.]QXN75578.1 MAG: capsid protein [Genomoviridae sp.]QXN75580.1 MAG: capsid protein [Genomoviridae sp.]
MVFRRSYARSTRNRRRTTRRVPRRTTRRVISRRRPMRNRYRSRRALLNITSKKKQDNMQPFYTTDGGTTGGSAIINITGNQGGQFIWCATARDRINGSDPTASATRESDLVFMRGLKEKIFISTTTPTSWRWRRICFAIKGTPFGFATGLQTSNGWSRMLWNRAGTTDAGTMNALVFKGVQNVDWNDLFTAKVDTQRVNLFYDKTRVLSSGNQQGKFFQDNRWYPMNKNLLYNNDENGEGEIDATFSVFSKPGMGDYYVMDLFDAAGGASGDSLQFRPEATLYWHEK